VARRRRARLGRPRRAEREGDGPREAARHGSRWSACWFVMPLRASVRPVCARVSVASLAYKEEDGEGVLSELSCSMS
jgi:hypothetical protein